MYRARSMKTIFLALLIAFLIACASEDEASPLDIESMYDFYKTTLKTEAYPHIKQQLGSLTKNATLNEAQLEALVQDWIESEASCSTEGIKTMPLDYQILRLEAMRKGGSLKWLSENMKHEYAAYIKEGKATASEVQEAERKNLEYVKECVSSFRENIDVERYKNI